MNGYVNDNRLTKKERLSGKRRIDRIFSEGESGFAYPFRYMFIADDISHDVEADSNTTDFKDNSEAGVAVIVSVSKRYHKRANKRNLLKRRTKEAFRTGKHEIGRQAAENSKSVGIALIYSTKDILEFNTISNAVGKILGEISKRI